MYGIETIKKLNALATGNYESSLMDSGTRGKIQSIHSAWSLEEIKARWNPQTDSIELEIGNRRGLGELGAELA